MQTVDDDPAMSPALEDFEQRKTFLRHTARQLVMRVWGCVPQSEDMVSGSYAQFPSDYRAEMLSIPYAYCNCKIGMNCTKHYFVVTVLCYICAFISCNCTSINFHFHKKNVKERWWWCDETTPSAQMGSTSTLNVWAWGKCRTAKRTGGVRMTARWRTILRSISALLIVQEKNSSFAAENEISAPTWGERMYHLECLGIESVPGIFFCLNNLRWYMNGSIHEVTICFLLVDNCLCPTCTRYGDQGALADGVLQYSLAATWEGLKDLDQRDAVRENDGPAMISNWAIDITTFINGGPGRKKHNKYLIIGHRLYVKYVKYFRMNMKWNYWIVSVMKKKKHKHCEKFFINEKVIVAWYLYRCPWLGSKTTARVWSGTERWMWWVVLVIAWRWT